MMELQDVRDLVAEIRRLATLFPDTTYTPAEIGDGETWCGYSEGTANGLAGCLVGQAARNIGLNGGLGFDMYDNEPASVSFVIRNETRTPAEKWTGELLTLATWAARVQMHQDRGVPWGSAVSRVDEQDAYEASVGEPAL